MTAWAKFIDELNGSRKRRHYSLGRNSGMRWADDEVKGR